MVLWKGMDSFSQGAGMQERADSESVELVAFEEGMESFSHGACEGGTGQRELCFGNTLQLLEALLVEALLLSHAGGIVVLGACANSFNLANTGG